MTPIAKLALEDGTVFTGTSLQITSDPEEIVIVPPLGTGLT